MMMIGRGHDDGEGTWGGDMMMIGRGHDDDREGT